MSKIPGLRGRRHKFVLPPPAKAENSTEPLEQTERRASTHDLRGTRMVRAPGPLDIDFRSSALHLREARDQDPLVVATARGARIILRSETQHDRATSTLFFSRRANSAGQEVLDLGFKLDYDHGVVTADHLHRTRTMLARGQHAGDFAVRAVQGIDQERAGYTDAFAIRTAGGMDLLAVINFRDRFVRLDNHGSIGDFSSTPVPTETMDIQTQLQEFGAVALAIGRQALPGVEETLVLEGPVAA